MVLFNCHKLCWRAPFVQSCAPPIGHAAMKRKSASNCFCSTNIFHMLHVKNIYAHYPNKWPKYIQMKVKMPYAGRPRKNTQNPPKTSHISPSFEGMFTFIRAWRQEAKRSFWTLWDERILWQLLVFCAKTVVTAVLEEWNFSRIQNVHHADDMCNIFDQIPKGLLSPGCASGVTASAWTTQPAVPNQLAGCIRNRRSSNWKLCLESNVSLYSSSQHNQQLLPPLTMNKSQDISKQSKELFPETGWVSPATTFNKRHAEQ